MSRLALATGTTIACPKTETKRYRSPLISVNHSSRSSVKLRSSSSSVEKVDEGMEKLKARAPRPVDVFLDEEAILSESTFPIQPADLIAHAKEILECQGGFLSNVEDIDTTSFVFQSPVLGPWNYATLRKNFSPAKFKEAFPVFFSCYHHFWVDPSEPSRVWYTSRMYTKHTGPLLGEPPTNKIVDQTPCMNSLVFNEEGRVVKATRDYVMDRDLGNTGGVGGAYGYFVAIGRPFPVPEGRPYQRSFGFRLFNFVNDVTRFFKKA